MQEVDFKNIAYLKTGNQRQQLAYAELRKLDIFNTLKDYTPLLAGTIPIGIDLPESDLDIICCCQNHEQFIELVMTAYGNRPDFTINTTIKNGIRVTFAQFSIPHFLIELFAQDVPSEEQYAFRHMLVEHRLLCENGPDFKAKIMALKQQGVKTEPAFAQVLNLPGDPYQALLHLL